MPSLPLASVFDDLPDPRRETQDKLHRLADILALATCAVIGGAGTWEAIAEFGRTKPASFRPHLRLDHGIPAPGKGSGVTKRLKAGGDEGYLLQVLQGITAWRVR
jgi:hypothetical protein